MRHVTVEYSTKIDETEIIRLLQEAGKFAAGKPRTNRRANTQSIPFS